MRGALPHAQAVQVQHLHLQGPAPALKAARQHLAAWQSATWPGTGDDEVLLLRRLQVQGRVAALGEVAAAEARALAARACGPWGPGADSALALRFGSQAEYLAWQLHQRLRAPGGAGLAGQAEAIADALCQRPLALPTLCHHLQRAAPGQGLARLWRALDAPSAQRVLSTVAMATGWGRSLAPAAATATPGAAVPPATQTALQGDAGRQAHQALAGLPPTEPRVRLAALLLLWQHAPARLATGDAALPLRQLAEQLSAANTRPAARPGAPPTQGWWRSDPPAPAGHAVPPAPLARAAAARGDSPNPAAARPTAPADSAQAHPPASVILPASPNLGELAGLGTATGPGTMTPPAAEAGETRFITTHGGAFLLFQVLTGPRFQQRLAGLTEAQAGWREWLCLARALGAELDAPLLAFAAQAALLDGPGQAAALRWPEAVAQPLCQAAESRYGAEALQAAIAPRPARVVAGAAQVDVHFRLADATLAVRRVGLDADPGWLPWLGRVLRWHYGSALAPQPHEGPRQTIPPAASTTAASPTPEPPP